VHTSGGGCSWTSAPAAPPARQWTFLPTEILENTPTMAFFLPNSRINIHEEKTFLLMFM